MMPNWALMLKSTLDPGLNLHSSQCICNDLSQPSVASPTEGAEIPNARGPSYMYPGKLGKCIFWDKISIFQAVK